MELVAAAATPMATQIYQADSNPACSMRDNLSGPSESD
jgi:hypothetical protein